LIGKRGFYRRAVTPKVTAKLKEDEFPKTASQIATVLCRQILEVVTFAAATRIYPQLTPDARHPLGSTNTSSMWIDLKK
jgi:hypothetical protein